MVKIEKFKRKKVGNQERGSSPTLEQLKQNTNVKFEEIYDYLDKIQHASLDDGGTILGNLDIKGNVTKNGQEIVTHNTDKSITFDGTFNKGSWNSVNPGALNQIIDNSNAMHNILSGHGKDGNRYYTVGLLDSYTDPQMRFFAGSSWFNLGKNGVNSDIGWNGDFPASGLLKSTKNGNTVTIGSQNTSYCHIYNSANIPFYFNRDLYILGKKVCTEKSAITLGLSSRTTVNYTSAWSSIKMPLNHLISSVGDAFTVTSNGIKANRSVNVVISGQISSITLPNAEIDFTIRTSTKGVISSAFIAGGQLNFTTLTFAPRARTLSAGEIVYLYYMFGLATSSTQFIGDGDTGGTYLTIQEV